MSIVLGTSEGVWQIQDSTTQLIGLEGRNATHVADRNGTILAAVPRDGLYEISNGDYRKLWEGDARACAVAPDGKLYVGTEPAMVYRSDDKGDSWKRLDKIDQLPTRGKWYFPPPPHLPHVRSIDFLPDIPGSVLVGVEVGGVLLSLDHGENWKEMNNGVHTDVHTVRPDPTRPGHLIAATAAGLYVSEDNGKSWQFYMEGLEQTYSVGVHINPNRAGEVLAATGERPPGINAQVYHSLDGGRSWERLTVHPLPEYYEMVPVLLFAEGSAWIMTDRGQVFRTTDPRGEWALVHELPASIHAASASGSPCSVASGHG